MANSILAYLVVLGLLAFGIWIGIDWWRSTIRRELWRDARERKLEELTKEELQKMLRFAITGRRARPRRELSQVEQRAIHGTLGLVSFVVYWSIVAAFVAVLAFVLWAVAT